MSFYQAIKNLHLITIYISITLFVLRFFLLQCQSGIMKQKWVKIVPHINDTLLLVSGVVLMTLTHFYPFVGYAPWMSEKLFGVLIYIVLGYIALSRKISHQGIRWGAFFAALFCFALVAVLAVTKTPFL